jgi:membrane fusion protein (multidrug efflux system)
MEATKRDGAAEESVASVQDLPVKKKAPNRAFLILGILAVVVVGGWGAYAWSTADQQNTDDAQVESEVVGIAPRVGGQISKVLIKEDQQVKKGDVLFEIDDADYTAREAQAAAELETAQAQAAASDAQLDVVRHTAKGGLSSAQAMVSGSSVGVYSADAQIAVAKAGLLRAQADLHRTEQDLARQKELRAANAVPQERLDNAQDAYDSAKAAVEQAQAQLNSANEAKKAAVSRVAEAKGRLDQSAPINAQIEVAKAQADLAHARVKSAQASEDLAKLQLSYTKVVAPNDGIVSKLSAREGATVQPGQALAELVPVGTYVLANFKETQIGRMKVGDMVDVTVDSFEGRHFRGSIQSLSGGTGARFSLLPPDNASGNFVKVVQRVPVRIAWSQPPDVPMRAGLSADVTVHLSK